MPENVNLTPTRTEQFQALRERQQVTTENAERNRESQAQQTNRVEQSANSVQAEQSNIDQNAIRQEQAEAIELARIERERSGSFGEARNFGERPEPSELTRVGRNVNIET